MNEQHNTTNKELTMGTHTDKDFYELKMLVEAQAANVVRSQETATRIEEQVERVAATVEKQAKSISKLEIGMTKLNETTKEHRDKLHRIDEGKGCVLGQSNAQAIKHIEADVARLYDSNKERRTTITELSGRTSMVEKDINEMYPKLKATLPTWVKKVVISVIMLILTGLIPASLMLYSDTKIMKTEVKEIQRVLKEVTEIKTSKSEHTKYFQPSEPMELTDAK